MNKITCLSKKLKEFFNEKAEKISIIALFTIIRTDHNMLLLYHSHKHISYPIRTIARSAIQQGL
ncbi:hypothetical protein [Wolbachia endosymbiont (group A) of Nomada hirtipes]|uniref:hypothetical protein n=1 Tax=Wolbachia endosymbiont (group A) of Nomada hirtipes TaxID=3066208 RepID=UPI0030D02982